MCGCVCRLQVAGGGYIRDLQPHPQPLPHQHMCLQLQTLGLTGKLIFISKCSSESCRFSTGTIVLCMFMVAGCSKHGQELIDLFLKSGCPIGVPTWVPIGCPLEGPKEPAKKNHEVEPSEICAPPCIPCLPRRGNHFTKWNREMGAR